MNGRVIVFADPDNPDGDTVEVFAVPGHWDNHDIARFAQNHYEDYEWAEYAVLDVKEAALS
jgi:hypothetical protein